ncbi:MAG: formamidopyrimidine-DNA glycosylase [Rhizobiaceae bacterium MnEN-MB40S]|nr:MAG: formamidopyrimidine-DNA glycosylase [Rhizobiaceae bacterium MnEN-MB40S]
MPELPEVETVRRGLAPAMEGGRIVGIRQNRPDLRFPFPDNFTDRLTGRRIERLDRRAKYILLELDDGAVLASHLGMSGSWRVEPAEGTEAIPGNFHHQRSKDGRHDHLIMDLDGPGGRHRIIYNDPRRFGYMFLSDVDRLAAHPMMAGLGVEPTGNALNADYLAARFDGRQVPVKAALLDQGIIAGLGNIYVCEALWRAKISPRRKAATLVDRRGKPVARLENLVAAIRQVIAEAIEAGGSSLRDHRQTDGSLGYFQHSFNAYGRTGEPCRHDGCGKPVRRIVQSGRSTFYCPSCQK